MTAIPRQPNSIQADLRSRTLEAVFYTGESTPLGEGAVIVTAQHVLAEKAYKVTVRTAQVGAGTAYGPAATVGYVEVKRHSQKQLTDALVSGVWAVATYDEFAEYRPHVTEAEEVTEDVTEAPEDTPENDTTEIDAVIAATVTHHDCVTQDDGDPDRVVHYDPTEGLAHVSYDGGAWKHLDDHEYLWLTDSLDPEQAIVLRNDVEFVGDVETDPGDTITVYRHSEGWIIDYDGSDGRQTVWTNDIRDNAEHQRAHEEYLHEQVIELNREVYGSTTTPPFIPSDQLALYESAARYNTV